MGKSHRSDSARARSQKQQKEAWRRAAPDARERIPTSADAAARSYHFYGAYQRNSNQKQRPSCQSFFRTLLQQELFGGGTEPVEIGFGETPLLTYSFHAR